MQIIRQQMARIVPTMHSHLPNHQKGYLKNLMTNCASGTSAARMMMDSDPDRKVHLSRHQATYFTNQFGSHNNGNVDNSSNSIKYLERVWTMFLHPCYFKE